MDEIIAIAQLLTMIVSEILFLLCIFTKIPSTLVIRLGFQQSEYTFTEPMTQTLIEDVTLIRENSVVSEQTFGISISSFGAGVNPATPQENPQQNDYAFEAANINILSLLFQPNVTNITVPFTLFPDELFEGTEGFGLAIASQGVEFPAFQLSTSNRAFANTQVRILDNDSKFLKACLDCYTLTPF